MLVKLTYFKGSGKFYGDGNYIDQDARKEVEPGTYKYKPLYEIFEEVAEKARNGNLPGLVEGCSEFIVLIDVPEHPHNHPRLVNLWRAIKEWKQDFTG